MRKSAKLIIQEILSRCEPGGLAAQMLEHLMNGVDDNVMLNEERETFVASQIYSLLNVVSTNKKGEDLVEQTRKSYESVLFLAMYINNCK